jgi:hypothetical protein
VPWAVTEGSYLKKKKKKKPWRIHDRTLLQVTCPHPDSSADVNFVIERNRMSLFYLKPDNKQD